MAKSLVLLIERIWLKFRNTVTKIGPWNSSGPNPWLLQIIPSINKIITICYWFTGNKIITNKLKIKVVAMDLNCCSCWWIYPMPEDLELLLPLVFWLPTMSCKSGIADLVPINHQSTKFGVNFDLLISPGMLCLRWIWMLILWPRICSKFLFYVPQNLETI